MGPWVDKGRCANLVYQGLMGDRGGHLITMTGRGGNSLCLWYLSENAYRSFWKF